MFFVLLVMYGVSGYWRCRVGDVVCVEGLLELLGLVFEFFFFVFLFYFLINGDRYFVDCFSFCLELGVICCFFGVDIF